MRHLGPPPRRYYTLIYRYASIKGNAWVHRFTSYDGKWRFGSWVSGQTTTPDTDWPPLVSLGPKAHWDRQAESALSWFGTFSFMLRWAVILGPDGKVLLDWKRQREKEAA